MTDHPAKSDEFDPPNLGMRSYNTDAGFTVDDPDAGVYNTDRLNLALQYPRTCCVEIPNCNYIAFIGTAIAQKMNGNGRFFTKDSTGGIPGYWVDATDPPMGGLTQLIKLDNLPLIRSRGCGFNSEDPLGWHWPNGGNIFEQEGRGDIATGHNRFENQIVTGGTFVKCLGGYYNDSDVFVPDENHAEEIRIYNCKFCNSDAIFDTENSQASCSEIIGCDVHYIDGGPDTIIAWLRRPSGIFMDRIRVIHPRCHMVKVGDWDNGFNGYSPHNPEINIRWFKRDRFDPNQIATEDNWLSILTYASQPETVAAHDYILRVAGQIPTANTNVDLTKLWRVPLSGPAMPRNRWNVFIYGLPKTYNLDGTKVR
jgi:hypothetical protein